MRNERDRSMYQFADESLHQLSPALQVEDMESLLEQVAPEQRKDFLERQSSTASRRTNQDTDLEESSPSYQVPQASQSSLSSTSSFSGHVSKRNSGSSKGAKHRKGGQKHPSPKLERLAYSSAVVYKRRSKKDLSRLATPPRGRSQHSKRPSSRVLETTHGSMDRSSPFEGFNQDNTYSASSNPRVVSHVSEQPSSAGT